MKLSKVFSSSCGSGVKNMVMLNPENEGSQQQTMLTPLERDVTEFTARMKRQQLRAAILADPVDASGRGLTDEEREKLAPLVAARDNKLHGIGVVGDLFSDKEIASLENQRYRHREGYAHEDPEIAARNRRMGRFLKGQVHQG